MDVFAALERDWDHLAHRHQTPAAQAAAQPQGDTMAQPFDTIHTWLNRAEHIGPEVLADVETVLANPAAASLFRVLAQVAAPAVGMTPATLSAVETLLAAYVPQQAAQQQAGQ